MANGNGNGRWETHRQTQPTLRRLFKRPITTKELREHFGGSSEHVQTFRRNNDVEVLHEAPQLNYVKNWLQALAIAERTPADYMLAGRMLFQGLERVAQTRRTRKNLENMLKVLRQASTHFTDLADELEAHLAETDEQEETIGTDGSVHSSESD